MSKSRRVGLRLFAWRRLRWVALGAAARFAIRKTTARSVDRAAADLEEKLPAPLRRALEVVPADAVRAGGSAVVAGRTARRVAVGTRQLAVGTRRVGAVTTDGGRRLSNGLQRLRNVRDEVGQEANSARRELTAEYLRATEGNAAADDALLDLRELSEDAEEDLPELVEPTRPGRWRADRRLRPPLVNRVQRSYRPLPRPWDR